MRRLFARETAAPAAVVQRACLGGEKVLAAAEARDGTWLLATRAALVLVEPLEAAGVTTIPWQQVETADWSRDDDRLRVCEVGEYGEPPATPAPSTSASASAVPTPDPGDAVDAADACAYHPVS
jgi:hypothetical protein